jgi:hypothetical protein
MPADCDVIWMYFTAAYALYLEAIVVLVRSFSWTIGLQISDTVQRSFEIESELDHIFFYQSRAAGNI